MSPVNVRLTDLISDLNNELPDADLLAKIGAAQQRAHTLSDLGDQLVGHYVALARSEGASWSQIGDAIGVSKQAAQQKLGMPRKGGVTFERFTQRARDVVVFSQEVARAHQHEEIGTEHVLLGLLRDPLGLSAKVLATLAGSTDRVRAATEARFPADGKKALKGHIPFTAQSKEALAQALQAALRFGHNYIGTEHVLLGMLAVEDATGTLILADLGITQEAVEQELRKELLRFAAQKAELAKQSGIADDSSDKSGEASEGSDATSGEVADKNQENQD